MRLLIHNSYSQLEGLTLDQHRSLKKVLSYQIPCNYYTGSHRSNTRYLVSKDGVFPTGLLSKVLSWLEASKLLPPQIDRRNVPTRLLERYRANWEHTPYSAQLTAVNAAIAAHRGTISMPTGSGKSITMAHLVNALQVRTLIVVPNLSLKHQLTESFTKIFGTLKNITILNIDSAELKKAKNYDCLIIDEAHHVAASTYRKLNKSVWNGIYYRYFFTATSFRGQEEEQMLMEAISGQIIYKLSYLEAVRANMILPLEAFYVEISQMKETEGNNWPRVYKELVVNNIGRNNVITNLLASFQYAKVSALCLVKELAHGQKLKTSLIPFAHGENEDTQALIKAFSKGPGCLIGTMGVVGEGVDTKACEYVILAGLGKSKPSLMQAFGRCLRTSSGKVSGKVIIIRDDSHKWTIAHFKAQVKVLKEEYGCVPVKLDVD